MSTASHAVLMDGVYRHQRHIYDLTRKYYLLGRDRLLDGLNVPAQGTVLELGCGTGRNIIMAARRYPDARFFGLDISTEMLETAKAAVAREGLSHRVTLAQGDATHFDAAALFGLDRFDRVFVSYALSMIPDWQRTITAALGAIAPHGSLHIVDFSQQSGLPRWFRNALHRWLARFHVEPRAELVQELSRQSEAAGARLRFTPLYRDYACLAVLTRS